MSAEQFYVGYLPQAPPGVARFVRVRVALLFVLVAAAAVLLGSTHRLLPAARFEYGAPVELSGTVLARPYPHLLVPRPGEVGERFPFSDYLLVAPWKRGADELVAPFDGRRVRLAATLAYRDGVVVAEVVPGSLRAEGEGPPAPGAISLGERTLRGEIVDSKCFFGVMNPGELKTHRACAARCISGGIPPVLCVRDAAGRASYVWLTDAAGAPLHQAVLDFVAEPIEIRGELLVLGETLVLRADPSTYQRLP